MKQSKMALCLSFAIVLVGFAATALAAPSFEEARSEFGHATSRLVDPLEGTWDCLNHPQSTTSTPSYSFRFSFDSRNKLVESEGRFVGRAKETGEIFLAEDIGQEMEKVFVIRVMNDGRLIMEHVINYSLPHWDLPYSLAVSGDWTIGYLTCERRK